MAILDFITSRRVEETCTIPIFPLNAVLFPGGLLPLKLFEQRYMDMAKVCLSEKKPFGVCLIKEGSEVGVPPTRRWQSHPGREAGQRGASRQRGAEHRVRRMASTDAAALRLLRATSSLTSPCAMPTRRSSSPWRMPEKRKANLSHWFSNTAAGWSRFMLQLPATSRNVPPRHRCWNRCNKTMHS